jgi:hypothetical protein
MMRRRIIMIGVMLFALAVLVAPLSLRAIDARCGIHRYPTGDEFVAWFRDNAVMPLFVHGALAPGQNLQHADIIVYGSSKVEYSIRARQLAAALGGGVSVFNAGMAGGETLHYFDRIVERLNLRNRILLINIDDNGIDETFTPNAKAADDMDIAQVLARYAIVYFRSYYDTFLGHLCIPRLPVDAPPRLVTRDVPRAYRQSESGDPNSALRQPSAVPAKGEFELAPGPEGVRFELAKIDLNEEIRSILRRWQAYGNRVILFTVPYGGGRGIQSNYNPALIDEVAAAIGGEAVRIDWQGITSRDNIHVDQASAGLVTQRLAMQLQVLFKGDAAAAVARQKNVVPKPTALPRADIYARQLAAMTALRDALTRQENGTDRYLPTPGWYRFDIGKDAALQAAYAPIAAKYDPTGELLRELRYISNGVGFKLILLDPASSKILQINTSRFNDPKRSGIGFGFWTPDYDNT